MSQKLFSPEDANRTLPLVRRIVADILEHGRELRRVAGKKDSEENSAKLESLGNRIHEFMHELREIGCDYTDWSFDKGLVDFPAMIEGRDVQLCWRSDEPRVTWYHEADETYAARKPIPEHLLPSEEKAFEAM